MDQKTERVEKWVIRIGGAVITGLLAVTAWGFGASVDSFRESVQRVAATVEKVATEAKQTSERVNEIQVSMAEVKSQLSFSNPAEIFRQAVTRDEIRQLIADQSPWPKQEAEIRQRISALERETGDSRKEMAELQALVKLLKERLDREGKPAAARGAGGAFCHGKIPQEKGGA